MTFTTAAASEMRDRVGAVTGKKMAKELVISTFHSFSLQLCRLHAEKYAQTFLFLTLPRFVFCIWVYHYLFAYHVRSTLIVQFHCFIYFNCYINHQGNDMYEEEKFHCVLQVIGPTNTSVREISLQV